MGSLTIILNFCELNRDKNHLFPLINIYIYIVFPLISTPSAYSVLKLKSLALIGGERLRKGGAYFKVIGIIHLKIENFQISE